MTAAARPVKTRFAPSPTGVPHVGLVRTALYNWAYARHMGGTFLFRIEDTDANRNTAESDSALIEALTWLGIDSDEGVTAGGEHGPYRQSERTAIYADMLEKLVAAGLAYESFSTKEEIKTRNLARGLTGDHGYDNHDRDITAAEKQSLRDAGVPSVYRLRMPDEDIVVNDLVRGRIVFPAGSTPDYVIARGDGSHLYAFVNALDDALMQVTHVLRGEDLLPSTPRQIAMYQALIKLGVTDFIPEFGHLPYIMGADNKKLSKRNPESNLFNLRDDGFLPAGLLNYLALLGWSVAADRDVFDMNEMVEKFDVAKINPNPAKFDIVKAAAINAEHLRMMDEEALLTAVLPYLTKAAVYHPSLLTPYMKQGLLNLMPDLKTRIKLLNEAVSYLKPVVVKNFDAKYKTPDAAAVDAITFLQTALDNLPGALFTAGGIEVAVTDLMEKTPHITNKNLWRPVRSALTGEKISLPLYPVMAAIGKYETLLRLNAALSLSK